MDYFDTLGATMCVVCPLPSAGKDSQVERGKARQDETCSSYLIFFGLEDKEEKMETEQLREVDNLSHMLKLIQRLCF